jgi:hypothetical protein
MPVGRSQMEFQISKPPMKKGTGKNAKGRMLPKGKGSLQSLPKRLRKRSNREMS